jgi:hypothetical protein
MENKAMRWDEQRNRENDDTFLGLGWRSCTTNEDGKSEFLNNSTILQ